MKVIDTIKTIREKKGISHEAMAINLGISQAAYTKLEQDKTKLTVDRLYEIAEILEVGIGDLLSIDPKSYHQDVHDNQSVNVVSQQIENFHQEAKEIYEKLIQSKDEQIAMLKSLLEKK